MDKKTYKIGDIIILQQTGPTYPSLKHPKVKKYIRLYEPINVRYYGSNKDNWSIESYYDTEFDLAKRTDLKWKIRCIVNFVLTTFYIISSNENHVLVCTRKAFEK